MCLTNVYIIVTLVWRGDPSPSCPTSGQYLSQTMTPEPQKHVTMGRSHDQTGSEPSRDPVPNPATKQSCDKEQEHNLMHAYFCRHNLCYVHNRY